MMNFFLIYQRFLCPEVHSRVEVDIRFKKIKSFIILISFNVEKFRANFVEPLQLKLEVDAGSQNF